MYPTKQHKPNPGDADMTNNIHYVNNTAADISAFFSVFTEAYKSGTLNEDFADLFIIEFFYGLNEDGSARMVISAA
jgi:hypothetical protein